MNIRGQETKQDVIDEMCKLLAIGPYPVGIGSTESAVFLREVATYFAIGIESASTKPVIAETIVLKAGLAWTPECDSRSSSSGGGSTVTLAGLKRLLQAVKILLTSSRASAETESAFVIDIQPDASALKLFKSLSFTPWYALGEFVDNSITSALKNYQLLKNNFGEEYVLRVGISFDYTDQSLTIVDNAAGITRSDFARAMKTSEPPEDSSVGLGLHGVGMKAAAFWWGRILEIQTQPLDEPNGWSIRIDLDSLEAGSSGLAKVEPIEHQSQVGTRIKIYGLWNGVPKGKTPSAIKRYLPSIYRSFLSDLRSNDEMKMVLTYQSDELRYTAPSILNAPFWPNPNGPLDGSKDLLWRDEVEIVLSDGKVVAGWIAILEKMSRDLSGFFLHYRGKGVAGVVPSADGEVLDGDIRSSSYKPKEIFGQSGSYRDQSFVGEFDVSQFGKTITTDSVMWTPEEEAEFVNLLLAYLQNPAKSYWDQASNMRRRSRPTHDITSDSEVISALTSQVSDQLKKFGFSHETAPTLDQVLEEEEVEHQTESNCENFTISDKELHEHDFEVQLTNDPTQPFLRVKEDSVRNTHRILVNLNHPALATLPPIHGPLRKLVVLWALSVGVAEVFLEGPERNRVRSKMNDLLNKFGGVIE